MQEMERPRTAFNSKATERMPLVRERHVSSGGNETAAGINIRKENVGLGFWQTFFISSGIISGFSATVLMTVLMYTGWLGFLIYAIVTVVLAYTLLLLGRCWNMVHDKWKDDRRPFGAIAYEACGNWARMTINALVDVTCFTGGSAMLLIVSDLFYIILGPVVHGTYCYWPLAFGLAVCPFMWLGTPKDSWQVGAVSILSNYLALFLILINGASHIDTSADVSPPPYTGWNLALVTTSAVFLPFIHFVIPVILRDMTCPQQFSKCGLTVYGAYNALLIPTLLVVYFAFRRFSDNIDKGGVSILYILPHDTMVIIPAVLLLLHTFMLMVPANNPLFQHIEEIFNIPEEFGWQRVFFRTVIALLQILLAETFPQFSVLMSLLSAMLLPLIGILAPALFYLRLRRIYMTDSSSAHPYRHRLDTISCVLVIVLCPVIMAVTSAVTIKAIANGDTLFVAPCYVNATAAHLQI